MNRWITARLPTIFIESRGIASVEIKTPYWSTWLDNNKAKFLLGWRPAFDLKRLIEEAWSYQRSEYGSAKGVVSGIASRY